MAFSTMFLGNRFRDCGSHDDQQAWTVIAYCKSANALLLIWQFSGNVDSRLARPGEGRDPYGKKSRRG